MTGAENETGAGAAAEAENGTGAAAIRIVRGEPDPAELAALLAVLAAVSSGGDPAPAAPPVSGWADRARYVRSPLSPGPNGWRAAAFPR